MTTFRQFIDYILHDSQEKLLARALFVLATPLLLIVVAVLSLIDLLQRRMA
jgi:hypothetical protein